MIKTLPITKVRENLPTLVANANKKWEEYEITVNGIPMAILISKAQYDSIIETEEILADKKLMADIRQSEKEIKEGKLYDWDEIKEELGFDVQNSTHAKSKKKAKRNF